MKAALFLLLLASQAFAEAAFAEDCGKFADPLAYNACLARQGPAARAVHVGTAHVGASPAARRSPRVYSAPRRGRSHMVFSPRR